MGQIIIIINAIAVATATCWVQVTLMKSQTAEHQRTDALSRH